MNPYAAPEPMEILLDLDVLGEPAWAVKVYGDPAPQGSKSYKGMRTSKKSGKRVPILVESSAGVKPWRDVVTAAALTVTPPGWVPLDGPLVMDLIVTLPKPLSAPKTLRRLPSPTPDLSKLLRSTEDALGTDTKRLGRAVIVDDARIVEFRRLTKVYAGDVFDPDALDRPGAVIRLWPYPPHLLGKLDLRSA